VPDDSEIMKLRARLLEFASSVRRLQQAGLGSATAELLLRRRRADLEDATERKDAQGTGQILQ
jgi:hypothetical protein